MKRRTAAGCLFAMAVLFSAEAATVDSIVLTGNLLLIGNGVEDYQPSPLVPAAGVTVPIRFSPLFSLEPGIDLFQWYYCFVDPEKAAPAQMDSRGERLVWGILLSPRCFFTFPLSETLGIGLYAAPGFFFPIPGKAWDADTPTAAEFAAYFYGKMRFLYPEAGFRLTWKARDAVALHVNVRSWWPLFHAWDGEEYPFYDQLLVSVGIGFSLSFSGFAKKTDPGAAGKAGTAEETKAAAPPAPAAAAGETEATPPDPAAEEEPSGAETPAAGGTE